MDQDALLARCQTLMAANDLEALDDLIPELEAAMPRTEAEWAALHAIFAKLGRKVWLEIVTKRFVAVERTNIAARLEEAKLASEGPARREEALELAADLKDLDIQAAEDFLRVGVIYSNCFEAGPASEFFAKASAADPDNINIRTRIIYAFLALGENVRAREELLKLQAIAGGKVDRLIVVVVLALRMAQMQVANQAMDAAVAVVAPDDHIHQAALIIQAARLGRTEDALRLAASTDYAQTRNIGMLEDVYLAIEGRGLLEAERRLVAAALDIKPAHEKFQERARIQTLAFASLFPSIDTGAAAAASRPRMMTRAVMDRVRELMFWR